MFAVDSVLASKNVLRSISLFKMKWASSGDKGIRKRKLCFVFLSFGSCDRFGATIVGMMKPLY